MNKLTFGLAATLMMVAGASATFADTVSDSFSAANPSPSVNSDGTYTYGQEALLPGDLPGLFTPYTNYSNTFGSAGIGVHFTGLNPDVPAVFKNLTGSPLAVAGSVTVAPGQLVLHPGPLGEFSVIRFTASEAGSYRVDAVFTGIDTGNTTTDVAVLRNGVAVANGTGNVNGYGASYSVPATVVSLAIGDTVDFRVGTGNGTYFNDSTALVANIAAVPLPPAVWGGLTLLGGLATAGIRARRRQLA